jgi:Amt family ammonium transporter
LIIGAVAGVLFVVAFSLTQFRWKIDDVLGVWPLHGLAGVWGGLACGVFGTQMFGGLGGVSFLAQLIGTVGGVAVAVIAGYIIYGGLKSLMGIRMSEEEEYQGADLSIHKITANPEEDIR